MSVTVNIPSVLRTYCGGDRKLAVEADTLGSALGELKRHHPSLYVCVCDETGAVRRHVNVFVNALRMQDREGMETKITTEDEITILPAVSGG